MASSNPSSKFLEASKFFKIPFLSEEMSLCELVKTKHCLVCSKQTVVNLRKAWMSFEDRLTFKGPGRRKTKPQGNGTTNLKAASVSFQTLGSTNIELLLFALTLANIIIKNVQCWPFEKLHRAPVPVKSQHLFLKLNYEQSQLALLVESPFCWQDRPPDLNKAWAVLFSPAFWPLLGSWLKPSLHGEPIYRVWKQHRDRGGLLTVPVGS